LTAEPHPWLATLDWSDNAVRFGPGAIACCECCGERCHGASLHTTVALGAA